MPRYDVFLSHASADKPAVEHLARKLRKEGLEPFLDKWHLIPGEPWQEALEEALDESHTCVVFVGKDWGSWQHEEMRSALDTRVKDGGFRVIPVLLPGGREPGREELPRFLRRLTWVDFRGSLDDEDTFRRLLAGIRGKAPGSGGGGGGGKPSLPYRCMAPAREPFVQRREYEEAVQALLGAESRGGGAPTIGLSTALQGAGGFGKTALAVELCYDPRVRERYPDGILWTVMGEDLDAAGRLARARDMIRLWSKEEPPAFETIAAAGKQMVELLSGKKVLLVVDDVWRSEDVTPFQGLGPEAALLITTRHRGILPEGTSIHVDAMDISDAIRLLAKDLPSGGGIELTALATRLGEWPLLLKLVNRHLSGWIKKGLDLRSALRRADEALTAKGLTYFDRRDADKRSQAVASTVEVSLERLSEAERKRFVLLVIFPESTDVPLAVLEKLWTLDPFDVEELASHLYDLSLLLRLDPQVRTIRLHEVIRSYLLRKWEVEIPAMHLSFLEACRPASSLWADLPFTESYLWHHLAHHVIGAGQNDVLRGLLLDFQFLLSKLTAAGINGLIGDYAHFADTDQELRFVRDALRLSAHILAKNPAELPGQLCGRLLDHQDAGIQGLLRQSEGFNALWLQPREASLVTPGGSLIRTIEHSELPTALSALNERQVVSCSGDGALRVWDVESGQSLRTLAGHSEWVYAVAVLDGRRVISGSDDGTLRVWDVESGELLGCFEGHSGGVHAVAVLDAQRVVSGSDDRTLRIWDVESGQTLCVLEGHLAGINAVAVLNRLHVVSGSEDGTVRVWDVESGTAIRAFEGHSDWISAVAVLDRQRVISCSDDRTLRIWDVESGESLRILEGHSAGISAIAVLDCQRVVSGSDDRTLRIWNIENGQTLRVLEHSAGVRTAVALNSRRVVSGSSDGTLRVWDVEGGNSLRVLDGNPNWGRTVAVLDDRRVISISDDGILQIWNADSGQAIRSLEGNSTRVRAVAMLDHRRLISGSDDRTLRVWGIDTGEILCSFTLDAPIATLAMIPGSRMIAASDTSGRLHFLDLVEPSSR